MRIAADGGNLPASGNGYRKAVKVKRTKAEFTMESFARTSRFIQPKRSSADGFADVSPKVDTTDASPTAVAMTTSHDAIGDILSNLENIFDSSFSKWDELRKMDEREHALMQGLIVPCDADDIIEKQGLNILSNAEGIIDMHKNDDATYNNADDVSDKTQQFSLVDRSFGLGAKRGGSLVPNEVVCFILWILLFLGWLRISSTLKPYPS